MEFRILGPLEIIASSERIDLGGARQQIVFATLLTSANRVVSMDRLLEALYGEDLPSTARSQVQISISGLRRFFSAYDQDALIATHPQGYLARISSGQLDSWKFEELAQAAATARDAGQLDQAVANFRDALRLWRGPALDGIESQVLRTIAYRLDEQRMSVSEDRFALELDLGRHHELVAELIEAVQSFPFRETLQAHLMLALYRCGRVAEALQVFANCRRMMVEELGIEPGERLQRLEHSILNCDSALDLPARTAIQPPTKQVPNLLPIDIADFTGREEQIRQIHCHLAPECGDETRLAVPVAVIVGKAGVGKTSIAVHVSHRLAHLCPDGLLFADLHGASAYPVGPMQVLERFLRATGVTSAHIPEGLDERAEMYRNMLSDRRVLVVLDDAASESQVSPLLPGSGSTGVIITSRRMLAGLAGVVRVELDVFDPGNSLALLARIAGAARVQAEPAAAVAIAEHCGHLPLALRIAGVRLVARPDWSIQQLSDRLADETHRLDELRHGDIGIRTSISLSFRSISPMARRLFWRLALLDLPQFPGWLGAALLDQELQPAEDLLGELVSAQLIETFGTERGVHSRYQFHDLIRVFARERLAAEEPEGERMAALRRALAALLYLAEKANIRHYGGDYFALQSNAPRWPLPDQLADKLVHDPLSWYERERATLVSGVRHAARAGFVELSWSLALSTVTLFEVRIYLDDWQQTNNIAMRAALKAHDLRGQAAMLYSSGALNLARQQFEEARRALTKAVQLFQITGDDLGRALAIRHIATIDRLSGRIDDAGRRYEQALETFRKAEDHIAAAYVLQMMAQIELERHQADPARELLCEALRLCELAPCVRVEAQVLYRMGEAHLLSRELSHAVSMFDAALQRTRGTGDVIGEVYALRGLGLARARLGELDAARAALERAVGLARSVGERMAETRALAALAELALASGDPAQAIALTERAACAFREMGTMLEAERCLALLGQARESLGREE